jgi:hypothetical protein
MRENDVIFQTIVYILGLISHTRFGNHIYPNQNHSNRLYIYIYGLDELINSFN